MRPAPASAPWARPPWPRTTGSSSPSATSVRFRLPCQRGALEYELTIDAAVNLLTQAAVADEPFDPVAFADDLADQIFTGFRADADLDLDRGVDANRAIFRL